ncbi:MAG: Rrf2 family transcriptional regulator [Coriobacteriales bacterium]|jgi:Rrf2 family protein|nr:Rrf2 family transcriptional regulator [Coriobacteriales bacterium]
MDVTRRTDYAIRLIAALTLSDSKPLSVREAAQEYDVPYAFARSIQHALVQAGLIKSIRGAQGGMLLAVDPNKLTLFKLIEAVQGPVNVSVCTSDYEWCSRVNKCEFHQVWEGANAILADYLDSVSIRQLLDGETAHLTELSNALQNKA